MPESKRYLAAILFTDIEGYTSMMQRDEEEALKAIRRHQEILEALIPECEGSIYQFLGDGSLSIFHSSNQAVTCALRCQEEFLKEPLVPVRMGIHIGEIYHENERIYGDGVNVASRIESIGQAGTVLFSGQVYDKIRNNRKFDIGKLGSFEFKNVGDPVGVYFLKNETIRQPDQKNIRGKLKKKQGASRLFTRTYASLGVLLLLLLASGYLFLKKEPVESPNGVTGLQSIAVLPFQTASDSKDDTLFSVGIAEDILTQLSKLQGVKVISRASSFKYSPSGTPSKTIAKELGVECILKGSVRKQNDALRISVQLIDPDDDSYLWAEQYDGQMTDVFKLQRDVAIAISDALKAEFNPAARSQLELIKEVDVEAYARYQKGQELLKRSSGTQKEIEEAIKNFEEAVSIDSTFYLAYVGLAECYMESVFWQRRANEYAIPKAKEAVSKALAADPGIGECYGILGTIDLNQNLLVSAERNLKKAIALSPNYSFGYERLAWTLYFKGEKENFWVYMDKAIQLDPLSSRYLGGLSQYYVSENKYEEGIAKTKEYLKLFPNDNFLLWSLAYLYTINGEYSIAISLFESRTIGTKTNWMLGYAYARSGNISKAREIIEYHIERAKTGYVPDYMIAVQYMGIGEYETALDYLEKGKDDTGGAFFYHYIDQDPIFKPVMEHPRFQEIVDSWNSTVVK